MIEIVPMTEDDELQKDDTQTDFKTVKSEPHEDRDIEGNFSTVNINLANCCHRVHCG